MTPGCFSSIATYKQPLQDMILVCTLFCLNTLVRKRNCCQRKANCKQNNNSLGKSKAIRTAGLYPPSTSQRSAVQIHLFWGRYFFTHWFPFQLRYVREIYLAAVWDQKYIQASIIKFLLFLSCNTELPSRAKSFRYLCTKFQRQINHILMPTNRVSVGNTDISDRSSWAELC